ncbi:MAG: flavodoxin [Bacteroidetes bacterium]|nr:MAG: flavodoxin [Bacteroidota bacterium]
MAKLIVYMTSHGCAEKAANLIGDMLPGEVRVVNLENTDPPPLDSFDTVIIGGSIRIGSIQKRIRKFCDKQIETLLKKQIGLYICCMYEDEKARVQLLNNYPEVLVNHAKATGVFGGELDFNAMNAFEKMIIRDVIGITVNISLFDEKAVREFVERMLDPVASLRSQ